MKVRGIPGVSIYKPAARRGENQKYLTAYEEDGQRRVESVSTDLGFTKRYAREISRRVELKRLGLVTPEQERQLRESQRKLADHLADYVAELRARGCTNDHVVTNETRVRRVFEACSCEYIRELSPSRVQRAVGTIQKLNQKGEPIGPLSAQSRNHYLTAVVCFFTWLKQDGRVPENIFGDKVLRRFNVEADRKLVRRIVDEQQLHQLIRAADEGGEWSSTKNRLLMITGAVRGDVYRVCLATGLRSNEVATLRVCDLLLDDDEGPAIRVSAKRAKNRRESLQPIKPSLAERLRVHVRGKRATDRVFVLPRKRGAEMLRFDLAAAGIPYEDEEGRVFDFHALRYECGSLMVARGENLKVVQQHMRHSSITLTMDRYAQLQVNDAVSAVNNLPDFGTLPPGQQQLQQQRATGTHGRNARWHPPVRSAPVQRSNVRQRPALSLSDPDENQPEVADGDGVSGANPRAIESTRGVARTRDLRFRKPALAEITAHTPASATIENSQTSGCSSTLPCASGAHVSAPGIAHAGECTKISKKSAGTRAVTPPSTPPAASPTQPSNADLMEQIRLLSMQVHAMTAAKRSRKEGRS